MTRTEFEIRIGGFIRDLRARKGLSPKEAAKLCDSTLRRWNHYESKGTNSFRALLKIAFTLDGTAAFFDNIFKTFPKESIAEITLENIVLPIKRNINLIEIAAYLRKEKRPWVKEKLKALYLLGKGTKVKIVAKRLGKRPHLIQSWLWKYNKNGVAWALASTKHHSQDGETTS